MEEAFLQQDRKEVKYILNTDTHIHAPAVSDTWRNHSVFPQISPPQENCSTSSSTSPVEPHPLLQQTHTLHCMLLEESAEP